MIKDLKRIQKMNTAFANAMYSGARGGGRGRHDRHGTELLRQVIRMGYPRFVGENHFVQTAAVGVSKDERVLYFWNRDFFDTLTTGSVAYVAAHETLHVIFDHMHRRENREPDKWNIACDITVNTILDMDYNFYPTSEMDSRVVAKTFGLDASDVRRMTTEEVYDKLPSNWQQQMYTNFDDHGTWKDIPKEVIERVKEEIRGAVEKMTANCTSYGVGSSGEMMQLQKDYIRPFPWQQLLRNRLASVRKPYDGDNWTRTHRKMYDQYPEVILPGAHEAQVETSSILVSIDTSGSMSEDNINEMVAIVKSLPPDQYEVRITWFDDGVYDAKDLSMAQGRGGTNFQGVEEVAIGEQEIGGSQDKLTRYPDVVIMMTDGYAPTPHPLHPKRWIWILTPGGSDGYVKGLDSTIWQLKD